jgi:hypothetical protein
MAANLRAREAKKVFVVFEILEYHDDDFINELNAV